MPRYSIAFITPKPALIHRLVEADTRSGALDVFFRDHVAPHGEYTGDAEGHAYFLEDFDASDDPMGSILEA
jgi:hypothetical protein